MLCTLRLRKRLDRFVCQRDEFLRQLQGTPQNLRRNDTARNLDLEPGYRLIRLHGDDPIQFVYRKFLFKKADNRIGRIFPETFIKVRFSLRNPAWIGERIAKERKILGNQRSQVQLDQQLYDGNRAKNIGGPSTAQ